MAEERPPPWMRFALLCRAVVVTLLSGWLTGRNYHEIEERLARSPVSEQIVVVSGVLLLLFLLALLAAQGGVLGLALYGLAVVLLAR